MALPILIGGALANAGWIAGTVGGLIGVSAGARWLRDRKAAKGIIEEFEKHGVPGVKRYCYQHGIVRNSDDMAAYLQVLQPELNELASKLASTKDAAHADLKSEAADKVYKQLRN